MFQTVRMVIVKMQRLYIVLGWLIAISSLVQASFPWLVSDDEKRSWFSGPKTSIIEDLFSPPVCIRKSPLGSQTTRQHEANIDISVTFSKLMEHPQFAFLRPRVNCRNTRNECPLLSCADPISNDGECCPTCHKEYIAVLLQSSNQPLSEVGRLHLIVSRKTMFISIKFDRFMKSKYLKFKRKESGAVLHSISSNEMVESETANRICVESELPNEQLAYLLLQEDVIVELTVNDSIKFEGSLAYFHKFSEVPFLALLVPRESTPNVPRIAGGFAGMTAEKDEDKVIIRTAIMFNDGEKMFDDTTEDLTVIVKVLKRPWKAEKLSPVLKRYSFNVRKEDMITGQPVLRTFEWQWPRSAHLRWMARSILFVTIEFTWRGYGSNLFGRLLVHDSCRKLYSVLSGGHVDSPSSTSSSGYAAVEIDAKAKMHVKVVGKGIAKTRKMDVFIVDGDDVILKNIATIRRNPEVDSFEASGTWEKLSASVLTLLYTGRIYVKVASHLQKNADMKGRIQQYLYLNQADYSKGSILSIHGINGEMSSQIGASAIFSADELCNIHYAIYISGYGDSSSAYKTINSVLKLDGAFDRGRRRSRGITLAGFNRNYISRGTFIDPSLDLLNGIASGMAHILISTRRMTTGELKGQVSLSSSRCSKIKKAGSNPLLQRSLAGSDLNVGVCLYQGRFYDHGAQWHPLDKDGVSKIYCKICKCNQRHVTVKQISCPKPSCSDPVTVHEHCCPVCTTPPNAKAVDPRKACTIGMPSRNEIRAVGEAWHPMIYPFGMIKCIVCICKSAPGDYKCTRVLCPKLKCKRAERFPGSCCPTCLDGKSQSSDVHTREITAAGTTNGKTKPGCKYGRISYKHGTSWKPMFPQFGILRCVICRCKNGRVRCRKLRCLKSSRCRIRNGKIPKDPCCRQCNLRRKP